MKFVKDEGVDIMFLTETWMKTHGDESKCVDLTPPGYKLRSFPRATRGGGLAVIYRDHFPLSVSTTFPFTHSSFELTELTLTAPEHIHFFLPLQTPTLQKKQSSPILSFSVSSLIFRDVVTLCEENLSYLETSTCILTSPPAL